MTLHLPPRTVALCLFALVVFLTMVNMVCHYFYFYQGGYGMLGLYFDVGLEGNIPTLYSTVAILVSAVLVWLRGFESKRSGDGQHRYWFGLAVIMAFLGVDEGVAIHEYIGYLFEQFMTAEGILYFLWVIPYGFATIIFVLVYLKFLARLPRRTALLFVVAGAIFVVGAIGLEMPESWVAERYGSGSLLYAILYTVEEFLEMSGIVLFIYAVLAHGAADGEPWTIRIARDPSAL